MIGALFLALGGAYYWVAGYDQFILFLRLNNYEITAAIAFIFGYAATQLVNRSASPHFSFLAIFAAMNVILNPLVIHLVQMRLHSPFVIGRGDEGLRSFAAGLLSLVTGIIALVRIMKCRSLFRGLPFAVFGIVGGTIWVGFWASLFIRFVSGMARW